MQNPTKGHKKVTSGSTFGLVRLPSPAFCALSTPNPDFSPWTGAVMFLRLRRTGARVMKSADMMESRVHRALAEKYGAGPVLVAACPPPEGEAIIGAMTRRDRCGSVEECRHFFDPPGRPGRDVDEARDFCPNAALFIDSAEKRRREEAGDHQA